MKKSDELKIQHSNLILTYGNLSNQVRQIEAAINQVVGKIQEALQEESKIVTVEEVK